VVGKESTPIKDAIAQGTQPLEALARIGGVNGLVKQDGQRTVKGLACPPVGVGIVGEEANEVLSCPFGRLDPAGTNRIVHGLGEEDRD
jgi:hypothetical protein